MMLILIPTHLKADVNPENPIHLGCKDSRCRFHPDNLVDGVDIREEVVIGDDALNVGVCLDCTVPHFVPEVFRGLIDYVWKVQQSFTGKKDQKLTENFIHEDANLCLLKGCIQSHWFREGTLSSLRDHLAKKTP